MGFEVVEKVAQEILHIAYLAAESAAVDWDYPVAWSTMWTKVFTTQATG